jgi:putative FmdB family regulatory protein
MPTYDYRCKKCGHELELYQSMSEAPKRKCPNCGKLSLDRLIGAGAGILFRGGGFYQTDYRSDSYKKSAEADSKSKSEGDSSGKKGKSDDAGTKATPKAEPKPEPKQRDSKPDSK